MCSAACLPLRDSDITMRKQDEKCTEHTWTLAAPWSQAQPSLDEIIWCPHDLQTREKEWMIIVLKHVVFRVLCYIHLKRPWCWERLRAGGEGDDRGWDSWMASPTQWTWVWVDSGNWWWPGRPGVLWFMGSQRVGHDWATEMNWTVTCDYFDNSWLMYYFPPFLADTVFLLI